MLRFFHFHCFLVAFFSATFSCFFALFFFLHARLFVFLMLADVADDAVFLAFSLEAFESAFQTLVLVDLDSRQNSHHLLCLKSSLIISNSAVPCQAFAKKNLKIPIFLTQTNRRATLCAPRKELRCLFQSCKSRDRKSVV